MANKVVRITRHEAEKAQISELQRIYGPEVEVVTINESMSTNSREFTARFDELAEGTTAVEAVLLSSLAGLMSLPYCLVRRKQKVL